VLEAILWGFIQGITEFLPISSDGHLVLVPEFLGLKAPDLATTALLHLGTLAAVIAYFRVEVASLVRVWSSESRRLWILLVVGTIPAAAALLVEDQVAALQKNPTVSALFLILTGLILLSSVLFRHRNRFMISARPLDALLIGIAQVFAILPGLSRSAVTITTGLARGFRQAEAARLSFFLGIPAVGAAAGLESYRLIQRGGIPTESWAGVAVAAVIGYLAIWLLLRWLTRGSLLPYAVYCLVVGSLAVTLLQVG
jgi:undecaprenyl-diphosphatase